MNSHVSKKILELLWLPVLCVAAAVIAWPPVAHGEGEEAGDEGIEYSADRMRDPFKSYIVKPVEQPSQQETEVEVVRQVPSFSIQGIFWGGNFPQAIINDKVVKEGDTLQDAKIISITKERIRFLFANREISVVPESQNLTTSISGSRKEVP
jgi:hypothetical protein